MGSSGAILSYIMCKAMNRSFFNVILGGFGDEAVRRRRAVDGATAGQVRFSADDAAFMLGNAERWSSCRATGWRSLALSTR